MCVIDNLEKFSTEVYDDNDKMLMVIFNLMTAWVEEEREVSS